MGNNSGFIEKLQSRIAKKRIEELLEQINTGNTEQLLSGITPHDEQKLKKQFEELDVSKLDALNIDINEILNRINPDELIKIKKRMGQISPEALQFLEDNYGK